ncbi:MAG: hypothetical protein CVU56_28905 [Deltaproteobacteria bacterium HGW-Deltaproteobacteria-14]|jgi:type II secretory pathway component GspD/PulD (secretin)|nr:MAG: hypothetical protein CVU56_28905 [Deltaproteobacteria bacterium HGW-Deltaproteobacteria-14]
MLRTLLAIATLTALISAPALAAPTPSRPVTGVRPACRPLPGDAPVRLRFVAAPIDEVLGFFACVTGARFVTREDLAGRRVDLAADGPVTLTDAWSGLLKALQRAGLEVVVDGDDVLVRRIEV